MLLAGLPSRKLNGRPLLVPMVFGMIQAIMALSEVKHGGNRLKVLVLLLVCMNTSLRRATRLLRT